MADASGAIDAAVEAPILCKRVRGMVGCGHPVSGHTGHDAQVADCCCCNRNQNLPDHVERCVDCNVRRIKFEHPDVETAGQIAVYLPVYLRRDFWHKAIQRHLDEELSASVAGKPDTQGGQSG